MSLVCSNPQCESRKKDAPPMFRINVTVDGDRDLTENLNKVESEYFVCVYCYNQATEGGAK